MSVHFLLNSVVNKLILACPFSFKLPANAQKKTFARNNLANAFLRISISSYLKLSYCIMQHIRHII